MSEDWIDIEFGVLCKFSQGVQVSKEKQYSENNEDRIRFLRIVDFTQGTEDFRYVEKPDISNVVSKDDISMVRYGTVGFVCTGKEGAIANNLFRVIPKINIENTYLINFLKSNLFKRHINSKGATMQALNSGLIKPIKIPLAPLPIQRAIVAKIEELFSSLDSGIADLKMAQEQLNFYEESLSLKVFKVDILKKKSLKTCELKDVVTFSQGIQVPKPQQKTYAEKGDVRFLRIIDFTQGKDEPRFISHPGEKYFVEKEDISMVRYGTVGYVCTGLEGAIANNLFRIIPKTEMDKRFLYYYFNSPLFRNAIKEGTKGATMPAISFGLLKKVVINFPTDLKEQKEIVLQLESDFSTCSYLKQVLIENLNRMEALRQSILKKAFEGKLLSNKEIEKCKKEHDYVPADVLLERIKAEKKKK